MNNIKNNIIPILIALLVGAQVISYIKINELEKQTRRAADNISGLYDTVNNRINAIYADVDAMLKKQSSSLEYANTAVGTPDTENLTVPVTFTVIPKEVGAGTALSLDFDGEILPMDRKDRSFSATAVFDIFSGGILPAVVISDGDVKKTEYNPILDTGSITERVLPRGFASLHGSMRADDRRYLRNGTIRWDYKPSELLPEIVFTAARLITTADETVVADRDIDMGILDGYEINEEIPADGVQRCVITLIVTDSLYLEHHYTLDTYEPGKNAQREQLFDDESIYASDGSLLWQRYMQP
jgi:hypothetical protein